MTNPDNIVRVRARNGGRASVYEANGWAQAYSMGLLEGNGVTQNTSADMNVLVGGSTTKPDVVIAENPAGYKIALDLVTQQAVAITAPASNSRISAIVAYTDDLSLQSTETDITGSPASCGLIVVNGTTAATPAVPDDSQIRSAITADGATGSQASYCIIATVEVAAGTTIITDSQITNRVAKLSSSNVDFTTFTPEVIGTTTGTLNYAIKYPDGRLTCVLTVSANVSGWTATGNVYYGNQQTNRPYYAVPFISQPAIVAQINTNNGGTNGWIYHSATSPTAQEQLTRAPKFNICRGASIGGTTNYRVDIIAEGFWK